MQVKSANNKVAYVVPIGKGLDSFVYREIEQLFELGLDITLYSTKFKKGDIYSPKPEWGCRVLTLRKIILLSPLLLLRLLLKPSLLLHALRNGALIELIFAVYYAPSMVAERARQIHCHFGDRKLFIGFYCKRLTGLPLSVTIHSHELHTNPNEKMFRVALKECDRIFTISQFAIDILRERYSVPSDLMVLNRLFLDMSVWSDKAPIRVITVGRFEEQKGFRYLFEAISLIENQNIEFVVVGFGPLDVRALATELGVADRVVFFDKLDQAQLRLLYQACDIYCLPSISHPTQGMEGIPVVLMEAMSCGLPVVATSAGAVPEIIDQVLVEEKSPEALAQAITQLADDPGLRKRQAGANRDRVSSEYSLKNVKALFAGLNEVARRHDPDTDGKT